MKARFTLGMIASLLVATLATLTLAAVNLNSSKSNAYRLTYPSDLVSRDQANAILAELDKMGPTDEAKLKQ
jgi:flagellar biosynthesis/type III secretory pathway M-ring protein FliF/YscJ